ncbi:MAG: hypothetical protein B7Y02_10035 [Rhodobacterales bacterium 17-64-5]|nr:MAG: hypothetical protein B7Y02_10035 [Rhodobacterales bacterium 17-64-5]
MLLVDLDPQGNASTGLGFAPADRKKTTYDLLLDETPLVEAVVGTEFAGLLLCPSSADLSSADIQLVSNEKRSFLLHDSLREPQVETLDLDFILIDCPPSLSLLTIREVRRSANPGLRIEGVVLTMVDGRNRLSQQVEHDARSTLGDLVFKSMIPRNVRLSEAPSYAQPVLSYDSASKGSEAYRALAAEILLRHPVRNRFKEEIV